MLSHIVDLITFKPIATVSAALFYTFLGLLAFWPRFRATAAGMFMHPISPKHAYLSAFDTFRAAAAILVAVGHSRGFTYPVLAETQEVFPWIRFAAKGVPMFAVLSGFLIYQSLIKTESLQDLRIYVIRRFLRIYPLYFFAVCLSLITGQILPANPETPVYSFILSEFLMLRSLGFPDFSIPVAWSLYVEVLFYILLPIFVLMVPPKRILTVCGILLILLIIADQGGRRELWLWKYFIFGIAAAECATRYARSITNRIASIAFIVGAIIFYGDFGGVRLEWGEGIPLLRHVNNRYTLGIGLASALILLSFTRPILPARLLGVTPLRIIGAASYSIFLIHPFFILANFPELLFNQVGARLGRYDHYVRQPYYYLPLLYLPGIVLWGMVVYLCIERPFLRLMRDLTNRRPVPPQQ